MNRTAVALMMLLALLVALSGCEAKPTPVMTLPAPTATVVPTPTEKPPPAFIPTFEPGGCSFSVPDGVQVECGSVAVPEDHADPSGPKIGIAVAVYRDASDEHLPDPVMLLSGGPGEKAVANAPGLAQVLAPILANRDFIVFDQRGVGLSDPALECPETVEMQFDLLMERDLAAAARAGYDAWMACRDRLVGEGHKLAAYTTQQNGADVNAIRVALGYDEVNLWGGSYGSHLAQAVMRDHPEGIRSVVLESVWPLEVSFFVETARTVPEAILKLIDACEVDEDCDRAFPDLQAVLFEVIDRLNAEPVGVTLTNPRDGQKVDALLTGQAVVANLTTVLYQTVTMPTVPQAIYDVYNGNYTLMTQLSSLRLAYANLVSRGMQMSVVCTDDLIGRTPDEIREIHESLPSQLVGQIDPATAVEFGIFGICKEWPVEKADPSVKDPAVSDIPTLILSGEFDHVTPVEFARLAAGHLSNSYLFEIPGAAHSGESTTPCALDITASFIDDPMAAPDAACLAELPGLVFTVPTAGGDIALQPYANEALGLSAVVPTGWTEVQPGVLVRGNPAVDMAVLQFAVEPLDAGEMLDSIAQNYGLTEVPEAEGERQGDDLLWSLYAFEVQGVPRDLALAQSGDVTLIVLMRSAPDERDALRESVFLPAVDAAVRSAR